jgi:hypothetical protein
MYPVTGEPLSEESGKVSILIVIEVYVYSNTAGGFTGDFGISAAIT